MSTITNSIEHTGITGPAGGNYYRIVSIQNHERVTIHTAAKNCALCGANGLLPVRPLLYPDSNFHGYVVPVLREVQVCAQGETEPQTHMLPLPFAANVVPFNHPMREVRGQATSSPRDRFDLGVGVGWMGHLGALLSLVADLKPRDAFNLEHQFGYAAGGREYQLGYASSDRQQGWRAASATDGMAPMRHGFTTVVYGREELGELHEGIGSDELALMAAHMPLTTANAGLATLIYLSRVAAGSLPRNPQKLWDLWEQALAETGAAEAAAPDGTEVTTEISRYHAAVLALAG